MTDEEELRILERAQFLYELGIPGLCVGGLLAFGGVFTTDISLVLTGGIISVVSVAAVEVGRHLKEKVLP